MSTKLIDIIAGARPNFMKIAPIIHELNKRASDDYLLCYRLVHTGQHYDSRLSRTFFEQLNIPHPDANLEVGSGTQANQTGLIMNRYEKLLINKPCDLCLVVGDVTSTMACAITAQKLGIPVAHVEAGIRSGDWSMPEEINRMVTDSITNWFFTTSEVANNNLRKQGINDDRIFFVGNTMIDTLLSNLNSLLEPNFWATLNLKKKEYLVLTLHRPTNVDELSSFANLLKTIGASTQQMRVIFPVHPRTAKIINKIEELPSNIYLVDPQPYLEFNYLMRHAKAIITDSGGITEETTVMGIPCITLRDNTERPETVFIGTNQLVGTKPKSLRLALEKLFAGDWKKGRIPDLWDGKAAERIVNHLERILYNKQ